MRIAGITPHSFVNGEGVRYTVFLQGCPHRCLDCHNPSTWEGEGGTEITPSAIAKDFMSRKFLNGITLSGGEPFLQERECVELLKQLPKVNVWIYTGYEYEDIQDTELARMADVLVVGRFEASKKCEGQYYGSSNQRIIRRTKDEQR